MKICAEFSTDVRTCFCCFAISLFLAAACSDAVYASESEVVDSYQAQYAAGLAYLKQSGDQNLDKAIMHLEKATSLSPRDSSAYVNLGVAYGRKGRIEDAVVALQLSLEIEPNNPNALLNLGTVYEQDGWHEAAEVCFRDAQTLDPNAPVVKEFLLRKGPGSSPKEDSSIKANALIDQGINFFEAGNFEKSLECYQKAAQSNRSSPDPRINIGNAYLALNQLDEAGRAYKLAVKLAPRDAQARYSLGNYYVAKKLWKEAVSELERSEALGFSHVGLYSNLGKTYFLGKEFQKSEAALGKLLKLSPNDAQGWYMLGLNYIQLKNGLKAREAFKKCIENDPKFAEAHYELGWLYAGYDPAYARKEFETVLQLNPSHEEARKELEKLTQR